MDYVKVIASLLDATNDKMDYDIKDCITYDYEVDGMSTLGENISDLIGLKLSYRAYLEFAKDYEKSSLPGLNYTTRQWFWIDAATTFHETDASLWNTNALSPAEALVNVAFAYWRITDGFLIDFACLIGSRMNLAHKCKFK